MSSASRAVVIANQRGLHARASAKFVNLASQIDAQIEVEKDANRVSGTSIMGLMMLGAGKGATLDLHATGSEAEAAIEALAGLVEAGFHESD